MSLYQIEKISENYIRLTYVWGLNILDSWKHCVASGCTEAAAANTEKENIAWLFGHFYFGLLISFKYIYYNIQYNSVMKCNSS